MQKETEDEVSGDRIQEALDRFNRFGTWIRLQCTALLVFVAARLDLCPNFVRQNLRLLKNYKRGQADAPPDDLDALSLTDSESRWPLRPPSISVVSRSPLVRASVAAAEVSLRGSISVAASGAGGRGNLCVDRQCGRGSLSVSVGGNARKLSAVRSERDLLADIEEGPSQSQQSAVASVSVAVEADEQEESDSSQSQRPEAAKAQRRLTAVAEMSLSVLDGATAGGAAEVLERRSSVSFSQSQSHSSFVFDDRAEPDFGWDTDPPIHDAVVVYADDPDDCLPKSVNYPVHLIVLYGYIVHVYVQYSTSILIYQYRVGKI